MNEVRNRLERLAERIAPAPDAFERLERSRRRRERNRRVATAVVALLVAGGGSVGLLTAIGRDDGKTVAAGGDVSDGLEITCDGSAVSMSTFAVEASEVGVKIDVTNAGSTTMTFAIAQEGGPASDASAEAIDPGTHTGFRPLAPGRYEASCSFPRMSGTNTPGASMAGPFEVVDPNGFYVDATLGCPDSSGYGMSSASASAAGDSGPRGEHGDPLQIVGAHLTGVEDGDRLQRAGYVASEAPLVRLLRDGTVVALVRLYDDGNGGWLFGDLEGCGSTGFGWNGEGGAVAEPAPAVSGPTGAVATGSTGRVGVAVGSTSSASSIAPDVICGEPMSELHLVGGDLGFDLACLAAPADVGLSLLFTNTDAGVPRNVAIYPMTDCLETALGRDDVACSLEEPVFRGDIIDGTGRKIEIVYDVPPLAPGRYWFQDDVHPNTARGLLIVGPIEG